MPIERLSSEECEDVALMKKRLSFFETEEGRLKGLNFIPGPRDVAIVTTPKAGTTWMQQICHQLRSGGNMEFSEISEVVPFLELAHDLGQVLEDPQFGDASNELRFFKTHAWAEHCPQFQLTIVVIRDPCDVLVSFYHFFEGWFFEPGTITLETFATEFFLQRGVPDNQLQNASYFVHLISWYKRRKEGNVMIVCFEDLKKDFEGQVNRVAKFLSKLDPRYSQESHRIEAAIAYSTYDFMKTHSGHFDEKLSKISRNEACLLPKDAGLRSSKIRRGESGVGASELPEQVRNQIEEKWAEIVLPVTGCARYEELQQHLFEECSTGFIN